MKRVQQQCAVTIMIVVACHSCTFGAQQPVNPELNLKQAQAVASWLQSRAIPLKNGQPWAGIDDLKPLETVLADVRVVGLGEATHGTREFFQVKHRMLEFLVTQMGFRLFAIEASAVACNNVNEYVLYGKGDPAKALASLNFWTYDTNEVSDMIAWMRAYNSSRPESDRVQFLGFDIQHPDGAFAVISSYLKRVAPAYVPDAEAAFQPLRLTEQEMFTFGNRPADQKARDLSRLQQLVEFIDSHHANFVAKSSEVEYQQVLEDARILLTFDQVFSTPLSDMKAVNEKRDRAMADNIEHILNSHGPDSRIVIWAHNGHIEADGSGMGGLLRHDFGQAYYAFGFTFDHGSFQARELAGNSLGNGKGVGALTEFTVGAAPEGSVGWYFAQATSNAPYSNYLVNLRNAPIEGPVADWLSSPHPMFSAGSVFSKDWLKRPQTGGEVLRNEFDGIVFIKQTTRARPNPTGMRGPLFSKRYGTP